MENQIKNIITHWWNDTMRKDWRIALANPIERNRRLDELADEICHHLTSQSSRRDITGVCSFCGADLEVLTDNEGNQFISRC